MRIPGDMMVSSLAGSRVYGYATETSDMDIRGVFYTPTSSMIGLLKVDDISSGEDINLDWKYQSLQKWLSLALDGDSGAIELIYTPERFVFGATDDWKDLVSIRSAILSRRLVRKVQGYLKGMEIATKKIPVGDGKRSVVAAARGYDVKAAMHTIRLIYMLTRLNVYSDFNPVLPDFTVRDCCYIRDEATYDQFKELYDRKLALIQDMKYEGLPDEPQVDMMNDWVVGVYTRRIRKESRWKR